MKQKILLLFMSLFLLFLAGVIVTLYMIFQTTANLDTLVNLHKVEIIRQELVINVQTVQSNLFTTGTLFGKELDDIVDNVLDLRDGVQRCGSCHHESPVKEGIEELQELTNQYKEALSYFITSTADRKRVERLQAVAADIGDTIIALSQDMALSANENLRMKTLAASEKVNKSKNILAFTILFSFVIALTIAVYLIRSITEPVSELLKATRKIKAGELGYVSAFEGRDEFRELIGSFNEMSRSLKETNEDILNHMARNQMILQTSIDGFMLFDEQGRILDINPALCETVGYLKEELLGMKFTDIEVLDSGFESENLLERIKQDKSLVFQADQKTKAGNLVTVEISATFTEMDGKGNYFCFIRDITERKKMEEEQAKVQKLESLGILAGGIAHDFNNLLTAILGYIDLSLRKIDPNEKLYFWLSNARKASDRAQNLTQQLLTFSKGGEPVKKPLQIARLIRESTQFVLSGSNVKCDYYLADDLWPVEADKGQISQVIQNIALNADQAMPTGGTLRVRAENIVVGRGEQLPVKKGEYVKISFVDEGIGIDSKHLTKIFDPYFTTKQAGNGLGLTICYSICKKHNGLLIAESELGVGTTFIVCLPAYRGDGQSGGELLDNSLPGGTGRILIMDDEVTVREIAHDLLAALGYEPDLARDGAEALEMYEQAMTTGRPYAAVIMDLTIPGGMGGKEAIVRLLAIDPQVRALVSSGYSNDPIMADYRRYGFCGVVAKPYDISQMSKALAELLGAKG